MGAAGSHAHVGLGKQRIAGINRECLHCLDALARLYLARGAYTALGIVFLHFALFLDGIDAVHLYACVHVEIGAQTCVRLQPEFVVRFNPVDAAVFPGKIAHSAIHLVVIGKIRYIIILGERTLQLNTEQIVWRIAYA